MDPILKKLNRRPPATDDDIAAFEKASGKVLPSDFVSFLKTTNGGEGFIGESAYVIFQGIDELMDTNIGYEIEALAPGLLLFGSDGGGEAFGFDTRKFPYSVVMVPFIVMSWEDALPFGDSFTDFLVRLNRGGPL